MIKYDKFRTSFFQHGVSGGIKIISKADLDRFYSILEAVSNKIGFEDLEQFLKMFLAEKYKLRDECQDINEVVLPDKLQQNLDKYVSRKTGMGLNTLAQLQKFIATFNEDLFSFDYVVKIPPGSSELVVTYEA